VNHFSVSIVPEAVVPTRLHRCPLVGHSCHSVQKISSRFPARIGHSGSKLSMPVFCPDQPMIV
jgi:hypothetical protein